MIKSLSLVAVCAVTVVGCDSGSSATPRRDITPVYSKETGKLAELTSDRDGDGKVDTRAFMDGVRIQRVEIDRDGMAGRTAGSSTARTGLRTTLSSSAWRSPRVRMVESFDGGFYKSGVISRVEEDTDGDDRVDKWEHYERGLLSRVELDLLGRGNPTQRLLYRVGGTVERVESDPDGDGTFELVKQAVAPVAAR